MKRQKQNVACQGASGAIRRRATLDTADAEKSRIKKEGMKRHIIFHSLLAVFFAVFPKYNLLLNLYSGVIMKGEIDNKRQDVGNANSLHPYAGEATSHTAYYAPIQV